MDKTEKVTVLMTVESVIAGFMITYGALVGQMLITWRELHGELFTTVFAGVLIYALVLTALRSMLLLFKSIDRKDQDDANYMAGYSLFKTLVYGSGLYVLLNVASILNFGITQKPVPYPATFENCAGLGIGFLAYAILYVGLWPRWQSRRMGRH